MEQLASLKENNMQIIEEKYNRKGKNIQYLATDKEKLLENYSFILSNIVENKSTFNGYN